MSLKKTFHFTLVALAIAFVISIINYSTSSKTFFLKDIALEFSINFLFAFVLTAGNEYFFSSLNKWLPWSTKPIQRLILGVVGSVILTMGLLFVLIGVIQIGFYNTTWEAYLENQSVSWYLTGILVTLFVATVFHAFYFYRAIQHSKYKEQKVIAGAATAQFDALKNQLDPHFLFNSLNVLVSLIEENQKAAVQFTTSLSKVYRYVLEQRNKQLVPLEEELSFARTYVRLLKMRFEESLEIHIEDQETASAVMIVPLSLQLLIENAVKHNIINATQPLKLSITVVQGKLVIQNNLQEKATISTGTGVGLSNIISRYALCTHQTVEVMKDRNHFKVSLPLIDKNDVKQVKTQIMATNTQESKLLKAQEKVKSIKEFYDEALRTLIILSFLGLLNYFTTDFPWVIFPAIGMGIGLFFTYMRSFDHNLLLGRNWKERKIEVLMNDQNF